MKQCQPINEIRKLSESEDNSLLGFSRSSAMDNIIWMNNELPESLRAKIKASYPQLIYEKKLESPHDPACEYFVCEECNVMIIFPMMRAK
jgi:hypothetical protein